LPQSWGQQQVVDASHLVVFAVNLNMTPEYVDRFLARTVEVQGGDLANLQKFGDVIKGFLAGNNGPIDLPNWATKQTYIALGQFMVSAAMLGIDTCPMEGIVPDKYDEILGLVGTGYKTVVACPAGYRSADDKYASKPKVRFPVAEMVQYI
jgi:nitroreductase